MEDRLNVLFGPEGGEPAPAEPSADSSAAAQKLRSMAQEYYDTTRALRAIERAEKCRNYYDGRQWTDGELAALAKRGQPPIVFNRIRRKVDSVLGVEQRMRTDPKAYPRQPRKDNAAEIATDALRYVADQNRLNRTLSEAFENAMIEGIGAVEVIVRREGDDTRIVVNRIDWDCFIHDPRSRRHDFSDARYLGTLQWMDVEDLASLYPAAAALVEKDIDAGSPAGSFMPGGEPDDRPDRLGWIDRKRRRVQLCQLYYKQGAAWRFGVVAGNTLIQDGPSYYQGERGETVCCIEAFSAYIDRDLARYGIVVDMIGPQDEVNSRRSKAIHFLHSRRVKAVRGAVLDPQRAREQMARPDGWIEIESGNPDDVQIISAAEETNGNLAMLSEAKAEIDMIGANNALQGKGTENQSGRAILAQQQAGLAELAPLYDRFNDFKLRVYRAMWTRIRQFWRAPKWIRVTDNPEAPSFIALNKISFDPMGNPVIDQMGRPVIENAVADMDVDIIIDVAPDTVTLQGEEFATIAEILPRLAQMPPAMAEILIEASSMPSAKKKRLLSMMQQPAQPDPAKDLAAEKMKADIARTNAEAELKAAQAKNAVVNGMTGLAALQPQMQPQPAPMYAPQPVAPPFGGQ